MTATSVNEPVRGNRPARIVIGRLFACRMSTPTRVSPKATGALTKDALEPNGGGTTRTRAAITGMTVAMCGERRRVWTMVAVIGFGPVARRSSVYAWSESAWEAATLIAVPGPPLLSLLTIRLPAVEATLPSATSNVVPRATARIVSIARAGRRRRLFAANPRESVHFMRSAGRRPAGIAGWRASRSSRCV